MYRFMQGLNRKHGLHLKVTYTYLTTYLPTRP
jgi:hypothetical protein